MGRLHREQDESFGSFSKKGQEIGSIPGGIGIDEESRKIGVDESWSKGD